ncbi:peptide chain release factor N(5)-glutamine methyltransferase [Leucobacter insecticola]|uniref:Release factor glutamine methyltransferase n=1 Tax=Leucobacter insecticola TaxID=2714934 RepID=A0A6G8FM86_9MICO|nr:peptide chain release factor N(5)-glutamine methyltransferase [Leucobacter insecticola]QIM17468.1 peptide chain release factor N(5)-glutamine methyltransferase [Leucobacter insecticola]
MLGEIRATLEDAGIEDPTVDAELIVGHVLKESRGRVQALAIMGTQLRDEQHDAIEDLVGERSRRVPLQHLTGRAPFRNLELAVGPGVFVPRPETESVAQYAIDALRAVRDPEPLALDLCTGSGALALALATEVPSARVWAVEKSREAHAWAERNVAEYGDGRVELLLGDLAELEAQDPDASPATPLGRALTPFTGRVHVLVSNPPYVPADMVPRDPEVRDHDPEMALYGGSDGLDIVRVISRVARGLVAPGGALVLEHAETQGRAIRDLLTADGWRSAATHPDLTGRDRTTTAVNGDRL